MSAWRYSSIRRITLHNQPIIKGDIMSTNVKYLLSAIIICIAPAITYAKTSQTPSPTELKHVGIISQCAKLLPENGRTYSLNLNVTIDASKNKLKPEGSMSISDNTNKELSNAEQHEVKAFKDCLIENIL